MRRGELYEHGNYYQTTYISGIPSKGCGDTVGECEKVRKLDWCYYWVFCMMWNMIKFFQLILI